MRMLYPLSLSLLLLCGSTRALAQGCDGAWAPGAPPAGVYPASARVHATLVLPDGDVLFGGEFTRVGPIEAHGIARFRPSTGEWFALGSGLDSGPVEALVRMPNGDIVAGGSFRTSGPADVPSAARWNGQTWTPLGVGLNGGIYALALTPEGDLIAGGNFNGTAASPFSMYYVARWDGLAWTGFQSSSSILALEVFSLLVLPNGDVIAGGRGVETGAGPLNAIARWNGSAWVTMGGGMSGTPPSVDSLARLANGNVVATGSFTAAGGVNAPYAAVWNGSTWAPFGGSVSSIPQKLFTRSNGDLLAVGAFTNASGTYRVARWNGAAWTEFPTVAGANVTGVTFNLAFTLAELPGGDWLLGGETVPTAPYAGIARWNAGPQSWNPVIPGGFNGAIRAFALLPNGDLVAGGQFTYVNGVAVNRIARWNGAAWTGLGTGMDGTVRALTVMPSGDLIAGGSFTTAGGAAASNIARWNGSTWSAIGSGTDGEVRALAVLDLNGGILVVGGAFAHAGGNAYANIASSNGTSFTALFTSPISGGLNGPVNDLEPVPGGGLLAAGAFNATELGSPAAGVAGWQTGFWLGLAGTPDGEVRAVAYHPTLGILAGGAFTRINGVNMRQVARWDGSSWSSTGFGLGSVQSTDAVSSLIVLPDGAVVAGGRFQNSFEVFRGMVARWNGTSWSSLGRGADPEVFALQSLGGGDFAAGGRFSNLAPTTGPSQASADYAEWIASDGVDGDGDGNDDLCDNCPYTANASQADVGGLGTASSADGIGDACQCGDVNGDGRLSNGDVSALRNGLRANISGVLAPDRCSVSGAVDAGIVPTGMRRDCDVADASLLRRALLALTPLPAQACEAAQP